MFRFSNELVEVRVMRNSRTSQARSLHALAFAVTTALALQLGGDGVSRSQAQAKGKAPDAAMVQKLCTQCHAASFYTSQRKGREEWRHSIEAMKELGMMAPEEQLEDAISYLTAELGAPLKINQANASELAKAMDMEGAEGEAIVAYRSKNGPFKKIEDVLKVPNISADRVLEQKKNLVF
mgnify:CR=1 FL=1